MRLRACFLIVVAVILASAQSSAPDGFEQWTAFSLGQISQELAKDADQNPHRVGTRRLADFPNDLYMLSHRESDGVPEWHETQADVFFVQSGSATLLVGGIMVNADTVEPHEKRNGTIQGGVRYKLSAGDVVRIPARVPHQLLLEGSKQFTYFVVKVKGC